MSQFSKGKDKKEIRGLNIFHEKYNQTIVAKILLTRSEKSAGSESIIIESDGLFTENSNWKNYISTYHTGKRLSRQC